MVKDSCADVLEQLEGAELGATTTEPVKVGSGIFGSLTSCGPRRGVVFMVLMGCIVLVNMWGSVLNLRLLMAPSGQLMDGSEIAESYCSAPLEVSATPAALIEHMHGQGLTLRQLVVTIRHGDRSAIHSIPGADDVEWPCPSTFQSDQVKQAWPGISKFQVVDLDGDAVDDTLQAQQIEEGVCSPGQLTERGVFQHLTLGGSFRTTYAAFLKGMKKADMLVQSTRYTRTLASAASFITGMLPHASFTPSIITDTGLSGEVMTGEAGCSQAEYLQEQESALFSVRTDVTNYIESLFGTDMAGSPITQLADVLHARSCHSLPLPCTGRSCFTREYAEAVMLEADRALCFRFFGARGGRKSSSLLIYPFLRELRKAMEKPQHKFILFSGHDTVIAPVLGALGAYDCIWPPYGSSLIFEVWGREGRADWTERTDKFVRVIYNARVVTQYITDCQTGSEYGLEFCPLEDFFATIESAIAPHATFQEACQ
ncbi:unnamed protein product [Chrysoparadoxa australica]